ncbi:MAG: hypothetical protein J1F38_07280 [Muribaculaceae bacterium]|nr:hypothetical protein [Muribaculaceae bacterium]
MESKVKLSTFSLLLTLLITGVLIVAVSYFLWNHEDKGIIGAVILFFMLISGWLYGPVTIAADEKSVTIKSVLRKQRLDISNIESVELFQPTMASIRIFGSGGYMGYWGVYRGYIGRYIAYYGKASDCFLINMKNGGKYVLGCENPEEMVNFINSKIQS